MLRELQSLLRPVRIQQRIDRAVRWAALGIVLGACLGAAWFLAVWYGWEASQWYGWLVLPAVVLVCWVLGFVWPTSWRRTAALIDAACGLKDRTSTALEFAGRSHRESVHQLQIDDALRRLADVDARRVVPWKSPKLIPLAMVTVVLLIAASFLRLPTATPIAAAEPLAVVTEQSKLLEETLLKDLRDLAQETKDPQLEQLADQMRQAIEDLKKPEVDQREALAELSDMQASLTSALEQLQIQQVDSQFQQLAEALQAADASQSASQMLKDQKYDEAARELEKIGVSTMDRKQQNALEAKLAELKNNLSKGKPGQLSEAVQDVLDGLENDDDSKCKSGMCKCACVCRKQGLKKKIGDCLACQLNRLSECKCNCQGQCDKPGSCVKKSNSPTNKWGLGARTSRSGKRRPNSTRNVINRTSRGLPAKDPARRNANQSRSPPGRGTLLPRSIRRVPQADGRSA